MKKLKSPIFFFSCSSFVGVFVDMHQLESDLISLDFNASGLVLISPMNFIGLNEIYKNMVKLTENGI